MTSYVVLSDLHANGRAFRAALARIEAERPDHVVVLGDLLTYGVDVDEVLDGVDRLQADRAAIVIEFQVGGESM